ncbi:MAG: hypothetical protein JXK05_14085 [Campylobacterales bacterium]|nr:hypothetical protein [Campylobacterales bacterium]
MKISLFLSIAFCLAAGGVIPQGYLFCKNEDTMLKILTLGDSRELSSFQEFYTFQSDMKTKRICGELHVNVNIDWFERTDKKNGITQLKDEKGSIYVITREIEE